MAQLKKVSEPFGEVNIHTVGKGKVAVKATILLEPHKEGAQTGIALDGSGSMSHAYGVVGGGNFFGKKKPKTNEITPVAQKICAYLARKMDADGGTTVIYWATGPGGSRVEVVGDFTAEQAEAHFFAAPDEFGTGTQLLPAVRYFADRFQDAKFGFYVFITDGEMHDLEEVKSYTRHLAQEIAAKRRHPMKFVLVGVGQSINEQQMEELDDLDTGTEIDLWDHKIAAEMRYLEDIFAEIVDRNARIAPRGRILDPQGRTVRDYSDTGVPALLEFEMADSAAYFTLELPGHPRVHQALKEGVALPVAEAEPVETPSAVPAAAAATALPAVTLAEIPAAPTPAAVAPPAAVATAASEEPLSQEAINESFLEAVNRLMLAEKQAGGGTAANS